MEKKHNRKYRRWNNNNHNDSSRSNKHDSPLHEDFDRSQTRKFHFVSHENLEAQAKKEEAIQEIKARQIVCPDCGELITDIASAVADKSTGKPVHFECVMNRLNETEKVGQNEKICYIGQGRFGILYFENPRDQRHFTIKKIIEWEERDKKIDWRDEMSGLYSQVE